MTNTAIVHPQSQKQPKLVKKITRKGYLTEVDNCIKHVSSSLEIFEKANEMGKQLGYTNLQIGRDFKQRAKALGKSDRTIQRFLPSEYKSKPRGATTPEKISAKMALNEAAIKMVEVEANVELPEAGELLQYEITGCYNNSVGDSSGAYYCKEHLEPMREKHALARKTAAEVVGKFLQLSGESQPQLKPELQPGQLAIPHSEWPDPSGHIMEECPNCKKSGYRYEGEPDEQGGYQLDYRHPDIKSYHWIICKIGRRIKEPKSNSNLDPNNPDSPYQKHLRAFKQELELQPQKRPELGDISLIQPKDFESFEQYPALLTKIANYWYDEAARLTNERNHARTIATQLQNKFGELASKLSLYQQSSSGLRYVENKNKQSQPGLQNQEHSPKRRKLCAPLEEVQKYCRKHEIKSKRQYQDACKKRDFSEVFPRSRADEYHGVSWNLVLGKEE